MRQNQFALVLMLFVVKWNSVFPGLYVSQKHSTILNEYGTVIWIIHNECSQGEQILETGIATQLQFWFRSLLWTLKVQFIITPWFMAPSPLKNWFLQKEQAKIIMSIVSFLLLDGRRYASEDLLKPLVLPSEIAVTAVLMRRQTRPPD
jgi:hypothetical protein